MSDKLLYMCRVCGVECDSHPVDENGIGQQAVCPEHCEDHDYQHDGWRNHYCIHCGAEPPDDWYYSDDDVPLFGGYVAPEPVGIPASAMNGNAAERHKNPEAWDRWVAFCKSWGMP